MKSFNATEKQQFSTANQLSGISDQVIRACLQALVQLHHEDDNDAILSFVGAIYEAQDNPLAEFMLSTIADFARLPKE